MESMARGLDYNWGRAAFAGSQFAEAVLPLSRYVRSHPDDTGGRSVFAISQFMTGTIAAALRRWSPLSEKVTWHPRQSTSMQSR